MIFSGPANGVGPLFNKTQIDEVCIMAMEMVIMDMGDFQEKMDPGHKGYLCQMLKTKDLPKNVLMRYMQAKILLDRIDGHLSPDVLALIVLVSGESFSVVDPEQTEKEAVEKTVPSDLAATGQPVEAAIPEGEPPVEKQIPEKKAAPIEAPAETAEQESTRLQEGEPVNESTGQGEAKPIVPPGEPAKLYSPAMPVAVLHNDEIIHGKIAGILPAEPGSGKPLRLTVELPGGDVITADEDDVEAE